MAHHKSHIQNYDSLQQLETISRKLASPDGLTLDDGEALMMKQLRSKENNAPHLHSLDQFFANSRVIRS